jgi:hypothetical protein
MGGPPGGGLAENPACPKKQENLAESAVIVAGKRAK